MADKVKDAAAEAAGPSKPGLLDNKLVLVLTMVLLQGAMAFAATKFLLQPTVQPHEVVEKEMDPDAAPVRGMLVSLDEMIITLNSSGRPRYLRTNIAVEAADAATGAVVTERMAQFRDAAIMALSTHSPEEMNTFEGKESVKAEMKESLKNLLSEGEIINVYFSDFVIQ